MINYTVRSCYILKEDNNRKICLSFSNYFIALLCITFFYISQLSTRRLFHFVCLLKLSISRGVSARCLSTSRPCARASVLFPGSGGAVVAHLPLRSATVVRWFSPPLRVRTPSSSTSCPSPAHSASLRREPRLQSRII